MRANDQHRAADCVLRSMGILCDAVHKLEFVDTWDTHLATELVRKKLWMESTTVLPPPLVGHAPTDTRVWSVIMATNECRFFQAMPGMPRVGGDGAPCIGDKGGATREICV